MRINYTICERIEMRRGQGPPH